MQSYKYTTGFTIVELLIAMTVFSVMLMVATTGVIQVGRTYYKGITTTKTQETTRGIVNEISESIQVGAGKDNEVSASPAPVTDEGPNGERAFCVGKVRYTYLINAQIKQPYIFDAAAKAAGTMTTPHALWLDILDGNGASCTAKDMDLSKVAPSDGDPTSDSDPIAKAKRRELLGANMRLTGFAINNITSTLTQVRVRIVYGDHDLTDPNGTIGTSQADLANDTCLPSGLGGQFCAISELETFVKKRLK